MGEKVTYAELPLDDIREHPQNDYSLDPTELEELADSIESSGLAQLPLVRVLDDGSYQMLCGHRRLLAYKRLRQRHPGGRWDRLPCSLVSGISDEIALARLHASNLVTRSMTQAERNRRIAEVFESTADARRKGDLSARGRKTSEVAAEIISEQTGTRVTPRTVERALAQDRRRREAEEQAAKLTGELDENWVTEASSGRVDPETLRSISELPMRAQADLFVDYQRESMSPTRLRERVRGAEPLTHRDGIKALRQAVEALSRAADVAEAGIPISRPLLADLRQELARLERAC